MLCPRGVTGECDPLGRWPSWPDRLGIVPGEVMPREVMPGETDVVITG